MKGSTHSTPTGFWQTIKEAFTPHPGRFDMMGAEAIDGTQAAAMEAARVSQEDAMDDYDLEKINAERRRKGLPPLSRSQADSAVASRSDDGGFDATHFLIGYMTGIPMPSAAGIIGAVMHPSPSQADCSPAYSAPDTPSFSSPGSCDSSYSSGGGSGDSGTSGGSGFGGC